MLENDDQMAIDQFLAEFYDEHVSTRIDYLSGLHAEEFEKNVDAKLARYFSVKASDPNYASDLLASVPSLKR